LYGTFCPTAIFLSSWCVDCDAHLRAVLLYDVIVILKPGVQTLGSTLVAASFLLLLIKVFTTKSVAGSSVSRRAPTSLVLWTSLLFLRAGISFKTLQAYALVFTARLASILVRASAHSPDRDASCTPQLYCTPLLPLILYCMFPMHQVYEGYLPYDKSGDWFYQATEILALLQVAVLIGAVVFL
jgi:hypothetical protein